jgi:hypothetical protein
MLRLLHITRLYRHQRHTMLGGVPRSGTAANSRIDRFALSVAKRSPVPVTARRASTPAVNGQISRRRLLTRALSAGVVAIVPLRLANPSAAQADGYCAAQCLNDANTAALGRFSTCAKAAFGVDLPTLQDYASYVASKIKFGGLGGLVVLTETARFDGCTVASEIRYHHDAGQCGTPNCGNPKKYPLKRGCDICSQFCCFCPTGAVAAGCLPTGDTQSCNNSCAACLQSKAAGFPVHGRC